MPSEKSGARRLALCAIAVLGVVGICLRATFTEVSEPAPAAALPEAPLAPVAESPAATQPPTTLAALIEEPRVAAPGARAVEADPPVHPHPTTPAHERIFRENNFLGSLNGALDVKDAAGFRRVLARYRAEYPEDALALQAGYELIADCLEHPGAETEAAARRYYDTETASTLRRYVRRHCLTPEPSP